MRRNTPLEIAAIDLNGFTMSKENWLTRTIPKALETIALVTAIITPLFFILGHLGAYIYFSSFNIQYFKYTNTSTAFNFILESLDVVISLIIFIVVMTTVGGKLLRTQCQYQYLRIKKIKKRYYLKNAPRFLLIVVSALFLIGSSINAMNAEGLKNSIQNRLYIPYDVTFNQGKDKLKCVTSIGSLGIFQVFVNSALQPVLIQQNSIQSAKPLFLSPPLIRLPGRKGWSYENPNFEKENEIWQSKWKDICPTIKENEFQIFRFTERFVEP